MRIDKIKTYYKDQSTVKKNSQIVPFNKQEGLYTPDELKKTVHKQLQQVEQVRINSLNGDIIHTIEIDGEAADKSMENTLLKLLQGLTSEKPLLLPTRIDIFDTGYINITSKEGNVITIKNLQKLLNHNQFKVILEEDIVNVNKGIAKSDLLSILNLKILADKPTDELKTSIEKIYKGIILNNLKTVQESKYNTNITKLFKELNIDGKTPLASNLRLIDTSDNLLGDINVIKLIDSNKDFKLFQNQIYVKLVDMASGELLINGKEISKHQNLLDYLFNRSSHQQTIKVYDQIKGIHYEIFLLDDQEKTLAIDLPSLGVLVLEEQYLKKIIYHLPQIASLYNQPKKNLLYNLLFIKNLNPKIIFIIIIAIFFIFIIN